MIDKEFLRLWFAERYVYFSFISVWAISRLTSSVLFVTGAIRTKTRQFRRRPTSWWWSCRRGTSSCTR